MSWAEVVGAGATIGITASAIIGAFAWLSRALVGHALTRDLELHKSGLEKELQLFKHELEAAEFERRASLEMLLERRAEIVAALHAKTVDMHRSVAAMVNLMQFVSQDADKAKQEETDRREAAAVAFNDFNDYFLKNEIYLDESVAAQVMAVRDIASQAFMDFDWAKGRFGNTADHKKWIEASDAMHKKVPAVLKVLKGEFRRLLGVTPRESSPDLNQATNS